MKVFITGVAGFLGSHLADFFLEKGHDVVGIDNMFGGSYDNLSKNIEFYPVDITQNIDLMASLMTDCDVVYHCAAAPYEGVSSFAPGFICDNIYSGSVNVFSAAIQAKVKRIVFCSSMARYGENIPPFKETYYPTPVDPYGIAKEAAERTLVNLCKTHGLEYVIAVPHNIYGPRQKYDDPFRNVASIMANMMLQDRQPIIYGDGKQIRCFSYIDDVLFCLGEMAISPHVVGETINIGPDEGSININQLAVLLADIIGFKDLKPVYMPDRPREVKHATCSSDKARVLLGYETKTNLKTGMTKLVDCIKEKGPKPFGYHMDLEIISDITPQTWKDKIF